MAIDYKYPLLITDQVFAYTRCSRLGTKSFDLEYLLVTKSGEEEKDQPDPRPENHGIPQAGVMVGSELVRVQQHQRAGILGGNSGVLQCRRQLRVFGARIEYHASGLECLNGVAIAVRQ